MTDQEIILNLEREAFRRWALGDADGFLEISDPELSYFDPFVEKRVDALPDLAALYHRTQWPPVESYELIDPRVQVAGDAAVLTFRFESRGSEGFARWNTTEVYRRTAAGWRIIHTHWALTKSQEPKP